MNPAGLTGAGAACHSSRSAPGGGEGRGEVGDSRAPAYTHLTLPSLRDGPLPLPPEGGRGCFTDGASEDGDADRRCASRTGARRQGRAAFADLPQLLALARHPNVAAKASALPRYSSEPYPYPKLHRYLRQVFDAFGPTRMFWGTDLTGIPCTYRQAVAMFTEELPWLHGDDLEWVMGRGICEWLGWRLPA